MATGLNVDLLRKQLEQRFGISLTSGVEEFEGGEFSVIRPADLEPGNGFSIVVARTHRRLEASFRADNFSALLLRGMSEADQQSRQTFHTLLSQAKMDQMQVYLAVNGVTSDALPDGADAWRKLEIDVTSRVSTSNPTTQHLAEQALAACSVCLSLVMVLLTIEDSAQQNRSEVSGMPEGALMKVLVNRYERSPANRAACIAHFGSLCRACGFDFLKVYGELGEGFVEVHHRIPVSLMGQNYFVNPISDLVPLCSNCHSMVHRCNPPLTVEALAELVAAGRAQHLDEPTAPH
jgi:5-methylcytosine-specific restriction enzyme A